MQMSLAVSMARCGLNEPDAAMLVFAGRVEEALRVATLRTARPGGADAMSLSLLAQMIGRMLLALGREQEAQEHFQAALRLHDQVSREWVRWSSNLDQGWTFLCMDRPGRAIECFRAVVEDAESPVEMAVEAMHGAADALMALGECQRALNLLDSSVDQCAAAGLEEMCALAECHRMELMALQIARRAAELSDHALSPGFRDSLPGAPAPADLRRELAEREHLMRDKPLVAQRLQHLQLTLTCVSDQASAVERFAECLVWLKERRLAGLEMNARVQTAIALLARGNGRAARESLAMLGRDEPRAGAGKYSMDVQYCLSKLYLLQGQVSDAMRAYKQHVEEAVYMIKRDLAQAHRIDAHARATTAPAGGDAARLRLPLKYRGAYQFVLDHLGDPGLSVRMVAAKAGVTERSLQMAFRAHLGMTPAEFIRRRRMERIRDELQAAGANGARVNVQEVAARWGVSNRSTLAHNYRQVYTESPTQTLQGLPRQSS
ncbi:helix-turn-helix domain-containing protein [Roseateles sp. SL47]|uniref:helix-turn-helix domain-containing protein n=1 Tax=Roseateles sp. SL47 TaxID=2995138 RepID=UPI00227079CF|nr:helix-turn-helix domain-containing protein [Roseateles sp. SL47]WAC71614.1 helix-turn-helix domain-containing protein [Roseateles sp. SL47]